MKILVPLDGSPESIKTLKWVANMLDPVTTSYILLYVVRTVPNAAQEVQEIEDAQRILKEAQELMTSLKCQVEKATYVYGEPANAICHYAEEINADQVLIGTHGRTSVARVLLGSVSAAVLERCHRPVFMYRNVIRHRIRPRGRRSRGEVKSVG